MEVSCLKLIYEVVKTLCCILVLSISGSHETKPTGIVSETASLKIPQYIQGAENVNIVRPQETKPTAYGNWIQYSLQSRPLVNDQSSPGSENKIANIVFVHVENQRVIPNNKPYSPTGNNAVSIRPKHGDLRKLDASLYKVIPSRHPSQKPGRVLGASKPRNNDANSPTRQDSVNHSSKSSENRLRSNPFQKIKQRCEFSSQLQRCDDDDDNSTAALDSDSNVHSGSILRVTRNTSDDGGGDNGVKSNFRFPPVPEIYSPRGHLNKRAAETNDTSPESGGDGRRPVPSTAEVHRGLLNLYRTTLNYTMFPNETHEAMMHCIGLLTTMFHNVEDDGNVYCDTSWDSYSCWPRTLAGTNASIPCPGYLHGINDANNASKYCMENGTWSKLAVYDMCVSEKDEPLPEDLEEDHLAAIRVIYNTGFCISTIALSIALFIFLYFRSLRCLRNAIHCHLIVTFIIKNVLWIIMRHSLIGLQDEVYSGICKTMTSLFNFAHATNFFWMFVEGLYLHIIFVWTYSADKIKLRYLVVIGWVLPAVDIIIWIIVRAKLEDDHCWLPQADGVSYYDYIFIAPILVVLFANIIFLSTIVWVLISKLRASLSLETRQYRKAVRATVILFPLLGITYVLFIMPPSNHPHVKIVFKYINAVLQSFQGLLVAVFYCFLNGEVKGVLKKKLTRFNDARTLSTRYTKTSVGWTRGGSRDYGNSVTMGNGNLIELHKKNDQVQTKDENETDTMLDQ